MITSEDIAGILSDLSTRAMSGEWEVDEFNAPEHPVLAKDKVNYVGQTVAVVVAESPQQARDALELIEVDYNPLPAIVDPREAAAKGSAEALLAQGPRRPVPPEVCSAVGTPGKSEQCRRAR